MSKVKEFVKRNWKPAAIVGGTWAGATALYGLSRYLFGSNEAADYFVRFVPTTMNAIAAGKAATMVYENESGRKLSPYERVFLSGAAALGAATLNEVWDNNTVAYMADGVPYMVGKGIESLTDIGVATTAATGLAALKHK